MKYEVTNITSVTYMGVVKLVPKKPTEVTKEVYTYLEDTFGKFNKFEFKTSGKVSKPKEDVVEPKEDVVEPKEDAVEPKVRKKSKK